jgi:hypothetical protein
MYNNISYTVLHAHTRFVPIMGRLACAVQAVGAASRMGKKSNVKDRKGVQTSLFLPRWDPACVCLWMPAVDAGGSRSRRYRMGMTWSHTNMLSTPQGRCLQASYSTSQFTIFIFFFKDDGVIQGHCLHLCRVRPRYVSIALQCPLV